MMDCNNSCTVSDPGHKDRWCVVCPAIALFITGLIGNLIALWIIYRHKIVARSNPVSVFYVLVSGLVWTDLLGKVLLSSMVLACYSLSKCLMDISEYLCHTFALLMSFFGLCSMLILLAMAVECLLSLGYPYMYHRYVTRRRALLTLISIYAFSVLFCLMPLFGFGKYRQYQPGTWCFISLNESEGIDKAFSLIYATFFALAILAVVICNLLVKINLMKMYRLTRSQSICSASSRGETPPSQVRHPKELDHLALLVLMTLIFLICSIPITVRAYIRVFSSYGCVDEQEEQRDLSAMRFLSVNSIVDPWVFIIFRTSCCRKLINKLFAKARMSRGSRKKDTTCHRLGTDTETTVTPCPANGLQLLETQAVTASQSPTNCIES